MDTVRPEVKESYQRPLILEVVCKQGQAGGRETSEEARKMVWLKELRTSSQVGKGDTEQWGLLRNCQQYLKMK